jgi:hypothetical protein
MKILFDRGNNKNLIAEKGKKSKVDFSVFSIRLRNLKESIAGFYTCEVSNGFQILTSTGFVRIKNPGIELISVDYHIYIFDYYIDINPIDLNDDLLVIDFYFLIKKKKRRLILDYHQLNFNLKLSRIMNNQ